MVIYTTLTKEILIKNSETDEINRVILNLQKIGYKIISVSEDKIVLIKKLNLIYDNNTANWQNSL